ncbi:cyclin-dependent kinase G-2-like [Impatiens glandulifera]|uniref:cyclin-dependent kinase G-2-like n=1 Tax=Impatiens glandulifera TaxID=253017 RepID=UPI001FB12637|nr:cyclin-dependent kinase G-2-like [Impatiens glandulifera]
MAAGRYGSYRDDQFKERESDFPVRKRDFSLSTSSEYDGSRHSQRGYINGRAPKRKMEDGVVRQKDIKERHQGYRSSSSRSDSGGHRSSSSSNSNGGGGDSSRQDGHPVVGVLDREPGELSSESGSDEATTTNSESQQVKTKEPPKRENHRSKPPLPVGRTNKRKFSPIVWDIDDKEVLNPLKKKSRAPPPPAIITFSLLPESIVQSPQHILDKAVDISPKRETTNSGYLSDNPQSVELLESRATAASMSPLNFPSSPVQEQRLGNYISKPLEEDDYVPTRNISASRWAGDANSPASPADEIEILQEEMCARRKMQFLESVTLNSHRKSLTPELREFEVGSEVDKTRPSGSVERRYHVRSFGRDDDHPDSDFHRNDYMDIDEGHVRSGISASESDTESDEMKRSKPTSEPHAPPQRMVDMLQGCRSVDEFERLNKIDEGTYGVVYRAKDKKTGEIVALKKVKMEKEREGFPLTSLREINILLSFHHPSIVDVKEVVVGSSLDSIFMVMEYMEHDLKALMETMKQPYSQSEVKCLMLQLLEGVKYLHDNWVLHRDLKTSNLLLNNKGDLKICDFGLARQYGIPLKPYTHLVVTLWYRAPELLLGTKQYSTAIDMWSLGCIMAELLSKEPLFNGKTEVDQIDKIFRSLGTPNDTIWPGFSKFPGVRANFVKHQYNLLRKKFPATSFTGSPVLSDAGFDLLNNLLTYDPEKRISAEAALNHEWFSEVPLPKSKEFMPTFPARHAQDRRLRRIMKIPDPLEEQRRKELQETELGTGGLFG